MSHQAPCTPELSVALSQIRTWNGSNSSTEGSMILLHNRNATGKEDIHNKQSIGHARMENPDENTGHLAIGPTTRIPRRW